MQEKEKLVGICKVGEKGQIVIPRDVRALFGIKPGDYMVVLADKQKGIALVKSDMFDAVTDSLFEGGKNDGN